MKRVILSFCLFGFLMAGCASTGTKQSGMSILFPYSEIEEFEQKVPGSYIQEFKYHKILGPDGVLYETPYKFLRPSDEKRTIKMYKRKTTFYQVADINGDNKADVIYFTEKDILLHRENDYAFYSDIFDCADYSLKYPDKHPDLLDYFKSAEDEGRTALELALWSPPWERKGS